MKKKHRLLLSALIFMSAVIPLKAQDTGSANIIPNGGFEEWRDKEYPTDWYIGSEFSPEQVRETRPEGTGMFSLKLWSNPGTIHSAHSIPVKGGATYTFSFWAKGNQSGNQIRVSLSWYKDEAYSGRAQIPLRTAAEEWKKVERAVTVPQGVNKVKIGLTPGVYRYAYILLDDISMVFQKGDDTADPELEAPKNLIIKAYQSEMEISWNKVTDSGVKWEVLFDGKMETITSQNSYIKTRLKPGSEHHVQVRAVKGKEFSAYAEKRSVTGKMGEAEDSEDRIPYLRTISPNSRCKGRFLQLFYNELANPHAKISYKLNGKAIEPKENTLEFPEFDGFHKQFRLEIHIDEGGGREWEILYPQLTVENS